jgi:hypothetical protein
MEAFVAEVLSPVETGRLQPTKQHWVVLEEAGELAMDALMRVVPRGSEIFIRATTLDEETIKRERLEPGVPVLFGTQRISAA